MGDGRGRLEAAAWSGMESGSMHLVSVTGKASE